MVGALVVTSLGEEQVRSSEWGGTGSFVRICATVVTPGPAVSPALVILLQAPVSIRENTSCNAPEGQKDHSRPVRCFDQYT